MNKLEKAFDLGYQKYLKDAFLRINVPDLPPYFQKKVKVAFKPKQIVDRLLLSRQRSIAIEIKKSKRKLISFSRFKPHQVEFLQDFHALVGDAYFLVSLHQFKKVFLIQIGDFLVMKKEIPKKSFNVNDIEDHPHVKITANKLRTNYRLDLRFLKKDKKKD